MSDIETVVMRSKKLELLLKSQYRAEGQGMHQLISSCEERLPHEVVKQLRYIATVRNNAVQDDAFELEDQRTFTQACEDCMAKLTPRSGRFIWRIAVLLMCVMTIASLLFYYINWEFLEPHLFR
ncbi:DUF4145 domain-containing protein [Vibrio sp.]|uniref:DUF4145 domain-containing protein n=1 Tax=Vibrio viridaestus TaxID=2487322 RepID=A0A3N9TBJ7_9VIBR|nr:DUF4145 domain-containing protein [Vibrio viridaestus]MDC0611238.1 DUF4145 domain-containing protein [Vibrio sp.]RQW61501.1 DUF4145 domain-containing protein [Vibrio viridaestus]